MSFRHTIQIGGAECVVHSGSKTAVLLGTELKQMGFGGCVAVVADTSAPKDIVQTADIALRAAGFKVQMIRVELTEQNKDLATVGKLYDWLTGIGLERRECLVAIGGGVAGDLVGFAAATWLRGVSLALMPTTLAAMVDASIGGKVGVNLQHGKNMVGAFHPARLVLQDTDALSSLDHRHWLTGLAEALKHGLIMDAELLQFMVDDHKALLARNNACRLRRRVAWRSHIGGHVRRRRDRAAAGHAEPR